MATADAMVEEGDQALRQRDLGGAERAYREALALDPRHVEALHSMGFVELQKRHYDAAMSFLNQALAIDSRHRDARQLLANAFLGLQRFSEAKREFLAVLDKNTPTMMVGQIGLCCEGERNYAEAEEWLRRALENDPSYVTRFNEIGMFHYTSLAADMHHALARVLQHQGKTVEAKLHYHLSKRNDATIVLDPMYREVMSDADLEDHVGFDAPDAPPKSGVQRLVWLARLQDWERIHQNVRTFSDEEMGELSDAIHHTQKANNLYVSARLRLVGDAIANQPEARVTFEAACSVSWQRFFELAERTLRAEIEADESARALNRLEFDWTTLPLLLRLIRRFVEIDQRTGLALSDTVQRLAARGPDVDDRAEAVLLHALALHRAGRSAQALQVLQRLSDTARDVRDETVLEILHHRSMILGESGEYERSLGPLTELVDRATRREIEDWEIQARITRMQVYLALGQAEDAYRDGERLLSFGERALAARRPGFVPDLLNRVATACARPWPQDVGDLLTPKESSQGFYRQAETAVNEQRIEQAIALLAQADQAARDERHHLGSADALALRARLLAQVERLGEAARDVETALQIGEPLGPSFDLVETLILAAHIARARKQSQEAVGHVERALGVARARKNEPAIRDSLRLLSELLIDTEPDRAVALFGESLRLGSAEGEPEDWADAVRSTAAEDWPAALAAYDRLLARQDPTSRGLHGPALVNKAMIACGLAQFDDATRDLHAAIATFETTGRKDRVADCMAKLVLVCERAGSDPIAELDTLVAYAEAQERPSERRSISRLAGSVAFELKEYEIAEPLLKTAIDIASTGEWRDARTEFDARGTLAQLFRRTERLEDAVQQYERALLLVNGLGDPGLEAALRGNMGIALRYLDRLDDAVDQYVRSIEIGENHGLLELCATQRINLAQALFLLGRTASGIEAALSAHQYYKARDDRMASRALALIGQECDSKDVPADVREAIERVAQAGLRSDDGMVRSWAESRAAITLMKKGKAREGELLIRGVARRQRMAKERYHEALTWLRWARAAIESGYMEQGRQAALSAQNLATEIHHRALLIECEQELCRALLILGDVAKAEASLSGLHEQWAGQRSSLVREADRVRLADRAASLTTAFADFYTRTGRRARALEVLETGRSAALLDRVGGEGTGPATVAMISRLLGKLDSQSTLVHFAWIKEELTALTLRPSEREPILAATGLSKQDVAAALADFDRDVRLYRGEGASMWEQRLAPIFTSIEARIPNGGHVVLVPTEDLSPLPLHALRLSDGIRVLERACVTYAPSMRCFEALAARRDWAGDLDAFLAIGVAFQDEALALCQRFGAQGITGNSVGPDDVMTRVARARVAHFACHGYFDSDNHLESGLVLRNTDHVLARDVLSAREVIRRRTNAELIVLSACETGRGITSASDYLDLGRAWLVSGARATVTALWNVDNSATQSLMLGFYRFLFDQGGGKQNVAEALRSAQLAAAQTMGFYDWAAFRLTGWPLLSRIRSPHDGR